MKDEKKSVSAVNLILILQLVVMIILFLLITFTISKTTRNNSIEHMGTITDERAQIINNYVENAEKTLTYYSKADQIKDVLKDPTNQDLIDRAYEYTLDYSKDVNNIEGIYVSEWSSHVLAHTNFKYPDTDLTTRTDPDKLLELQNALKDAGDGVFNTGIIISPATQKQVVSMYKAVYDENHEPIGIVGLGIFTDQLVKNLDNMPIRGIKNSTYSMVNVEDHTYIFNNDESKVTQEADNEEIIKLCEQFKGMPVNDTGYFEYVKDGKKYVSIYSYIASHGWILMIDDTQSEVFSLTRSMRLYLGIFALSVLGLIILFNFLNKKQQATAERLNTAVEKNTKTKESLNRAVFKDILTDVNNRVAFSMDVEKLYISSNRPYYFALFNLLGFSEINSKFGNDTGDLMLVNTVDMLRTALGSDSIYRTGSDEFVVVIPTDDNNSSSDVIINKINVLLNKLSRPQQTGSGMLSVNYKASLVKKVSSADTSVIAVLKDLADHGTAPADTVQYMDLG